MLIDDEDAIRSMLKQAIDWKSCNMEVVGEADSGSEAIDIIDDLQPDVLIVDIRMPYIDGIEFSRIITKRYERIRIIILTAYDDFNYAQECIEINNIVGYLLKPVDTQKMVHYLKKIQIDEEKEVKDRPQDISEDDLQIQYRIKKYIESNYSDPYLNVGAIAEQFGYNTSYISSYYKKTTGVSLSDEIYTYRMQQAIRFKKAGLKMYIVAQKVGITDPYYFSKCFKKFTHVSFKEFQQ